MRQREQHQLRSNAMGLNSLVFMVVATVGPMAAYMGAAPLVFAQIGAGAAGAYVLATALFAVFSAGYVAMSRNSGTAGGFVVFIAQAMGRRAGLAASYVTLLTYGAFVGALYGAYAVFLQQTAQQFFNLDLHWAVWALATAALIGVLTYNRVEFSARAMGVLLIAAVSAVLILDVAIIADGVAGGGTELSLAAFSPGNIFGEGFGLAFLFALASFGGFESTVVFSEEVRRPKVTIPRGTYIALLILGLFYAVSTWALGNAVGNTNVQAAAAEDPTGFVFAVAAHYVAPFWADLLSILVVTSFFAVLLGFSNVFSRYIFALARAEALPEVLSHTHPKHQSPHTASIAATATAVSIIIVFLVTGADPFATLYTWLLALGTVGILTLICITSLAAFLFFRKIPSDEGRWSTIIAPLISFAAFGAVIYLALTHYDLLAGQGIGQLLWVLIPLVALLGYLVATIRGDDKFDFSDLESTATEVPVPTPAPRDNATHEREIS